MAEVAKSVKVYKPANGVGNFKSGGALQKGSNRGSMPRKDSVGFVSNLFLVEKKKQGDETNHKFKGIKQLRAVQSLQ